MWPCRISAVFLSSLFLFLFVFLFLQGVGVGGNAIATQNPNLIEDTCRICSNGDPNINFTFCTYSLQSAPASHCASLPDLGKISLTLIANNVTDTRCFVKNILHQNTSTKIDPYIKECLADCFDLYSDAISSIKQAINYYNSSRFFDANIQISSVMDAATTCEDGFKEKKGIVSPLTKRNNDTFQLSAVSLSLMRMLQGKLN